MKKQKKDLSDLEKECLNYINKTPEFKYWIKIISENKYFGFSIGFKNMIKMYDRLLTPQAYSPRIQRYVTLKLNGRKVKPKENKGDIEIEKEYFEFKNSIINDTNDTINIVQIRLHQNVHYIVLYCDIIKDEYYCFKLTHDEMKEEVELIGQHAHGTETANVFNKNIEYGIRLSTMGKTTDLDRWKEKYLFNIDL